MTCCCMVCYRLMMFYCVMSCGWMVSGMMLISMDLMMFVMSSGMSCMCSCGMSMHNIVMRLFLVMWDVWMDYMRS